MKKRKILGSLFVACLMIFLSSCAHNRPPKVNRCILDNVDSCYMIYADPNEPNRSVPLEDVLGGVIYPIEDINKIKKWLRRVMDDLQDGVMREFNKNTGK